VKGKVL